MAVIQSHTKPFKSLKEHVLDVETAAQNILGRHSCAVKRFIENEMAFAIFFHDIGKAMPEFQKYIADPFKYKGNKRLKAHTPVSLLLWLLFARKKQIPKETILLVATAVWKHHGDFPTFESFLNGTLYDYEADYPVSEYPLEPVNKELNLELSIDSDAAVFDVDELFDDDFISRLPIKDASELKVRALLIFSVLLESDRTFLALSGEFLEQHLTPKPPVEIGPETVDVFLEKKSETGNQNATLNQCRTNLRRQIIKKSCQNAGIESVTLPTGLGKTMVAAQWALKNRTNNPRQKVIIVLPFLSIIDQTVKEYRALFGHIDADSLILESHSIAERQYAKDSHEDQNLKFNDVIDFFAETWGFDFVITTFDQFLYTLLSSNKNHLMRFHNLADALIIIDEVQALPPILWQPFSQVLNTVSETMNTRTLIMSATQPEFLETSELVPSPGGIFKKQNRYQLVFKHRNAVSLDAFIKDCKFRIEAENWHEKRALLVFNTRASAREVLDALERNIRCDLFFLSADVTPKERLQSIEEIKKNKPCLVIATQCIEAGVDIDMDFAIRDFAPLDCIVQCAGRCNRNGLKKRADIEIVSLLNLNGKPFSGFVYDRTLLEKTATVLSKTEKILHEEEIFPLVTNYFLEIKNSKNIGEVEAEEWAYWKKDLDVKKMLRGDNRKFSFIVASQDTPKNDELPIKDAVSMALALDDPWERKRKIRSFGGRIAALTISVWDNEGLDPEDVSEPIGCFHFLKNEFYTTGKGFSLSDNFQYGSSTQF